MAFEAASSLAPGVSAQTQALAFRETSALLRAGITVDNALEQSSHNGPPQFRNALLSLAAYTRDGKSLSGGLKFYPNIFNPVIPAIVGAGERTGHLDASFSMLAEFFEWEADLIRTLRSAMVYPTIVAVTAILAVGILSYINFMPGDWSVRLLWALAIAAGLWFAFRFRVVQRIARYIAMALPFFGAVMQELAVARFCQTFGLMIRAGVPYLEGLEATMPVIQHPAVDRAANHVYYGIRNGSTVEECIRGQYVFPPVVRNLVGAGEAAGTVDETLLRAAKYLRDDAQYKIANSAKLAGPMMTIIMAVIVLLIMISFWQSYFKNIMSVLE